jgi:hypothetical protein
MRIATGEKTEDAEKRDPAAADRGRLGGINPHSPDNAAILSALDAILI